MDLTSLISAIISATAALVAIIGGFLVSRVISISNDQSFLKRREDALRTDIKHKKELLEKVNTYLFEDDLEDFVTKDNLILLLKGKKLEEIIKESEFTFLTQEELSPHFDILIEIKEEVEDFIVSEDFEKKSIDEIIDQTDIKHPGRSDWYKKMEDAIQELYSPPTSQFPYFSPPRIPDHTEYRLKKREKEQLLNEIKILESQRTELENTINDYIEGSSIWSGIGVLIYSSLVGILYPATLLPYPINYYNDAQTKTLVIILFGSGLLSIFLYLIIAVYKMISRKKV